MQTSQSSRPQAVQVAKIVTSGEEPVMEFDVDAISSVIRDNGIEEKPVVVIAIAGVSRSGKSYLLSLMIAYLNHMSKSSNRPFQPSSSDISGMTWSAGGKAVTKGIWLWEKAFPIKKRDNSEINVLFLDTQGICDGTESAHPKVDSQIIYSTLSMATIYIHNLQKNFRIAEKQVYQICQSFNEVTGECIQDNDQEALFKSFTLLFRDWTNDEVYGQRNDLFSNEIEQAKGNEEASKIMMGIDRLFEKKVAWAFPVPSDALQRSRGNLSLEDAGDTFRGCVLEFLAALFTTDGHYNPQMDNALTGKRFITLMEGLSERLKNFPNLPSDADKLRDLFLSKAYDSAATEFEEKLKSIATESNPSMQEFDEELELAGKYAMEKFEKQAQKYNPDGNISKTYFEKLKEEIENAIKLKKSEKEGKDLKEENKKLTMCAVACAAGMVASSVGGAIVVGKIGVAGVITITAAGQGIAVPAGSGLAGMALGAGLGAAIEHFAPEKVKEIIGRLGAKNSPFAADASKTSASDAMCHTIGKKH